MGSSRMGRTLQHLAVDGDRAARPALPPAVSRRPAEWASATRSRASPTPVASTRPIMVRSGDRGEPAHLHGPGRHSRGPAGHPRDVGRRRRRGCRALDAHPHRTQEPRCGRRSHARLRRAQRRPVAALAKHREATDLWPAAIMCRRPRARSSRAATVFATCGQNRTTRLIFQGKRDSSVQNAEPRS